MTDRLPPGPYRTFNLPDGSPFPYYIIPFDKRGVCQAPQTRQHLIDSLGREGYSDVFLFSHGWNNDWTVATKRYDSFIQGYMKLRQDHSIPLTPGYKPLLIGIFWPSTALVFTEKEKGPDLAAGQPAAVDEAVAEERRELEELAEDLSPEETATLYNLAQKDSLDEGEARQLAQIATHFYRLEDDELGLDTGVTVDEILKIWDSVPAEGEEDDLSGLTAGAGGPGAAGIGGFLKKLDPRKLIRTFTVYKMKDRAGRVGSRGVHELLRDVLAGSSAKVHLAGHSFGAKVVLSATCAGDSLPRKVRSMLLLQPAVSHLCFAETVPTTNRSGGYRAALDRVDNPILSTYSEHDVPLTKAFHLGVRREADLGELRIAAAAGDPPSKYAALGGFGPRKAGERLIDILDPTTPYNLDPAVKIYGVDGSRTIDGHGDISNESTWWALHTLSSR